MRMNSTITAKVHPQNYQSVRENLVQDQISIAFRKTWEGKENTRFAIYEEKPKESSSDVVTREPREQLTSKDRTSQWLLSDMLQPEVMQDTTTNGWDTVAQIITGIDVEMMATANGADFVEYSAEPSEPYQPAKPRNDSMIQDDKSSGSTTPKASLMPSPIIASDATMWEAPALGDLWDTPLSDVDDIHFHDFWPVFVRVCEHLVGFSASGSEFASAAFWFDWKSRIVLNPETVGAALEVLNRLFRFLKARRSESEEKEKMLEEKIPDSPGRADRPGSTGTIGQTALHTQILPLQTQDTEMRKDSAVGVSPTMPLTSKEVPVDGSSEVPVSQPVSAVAPLPLANGERADNGVNKRPNTARGSNDPGFWAGATSPKRKSIELSGTDYEFAEFSRKTNRTSPVPIPEQTEKISPLPALEAFPASTSEPNPALIDPSQQQIKQLEELTDDVIFAVCRLWIAWSGWALSWDFKNHKESEKKDKGKGKIGSQKSPQEPHKAPSTSATATEILLVFFDSELLMSQVSLAKTRLESLEQGKLELKEEPYASFCVDTLRQNVQEVVLDKWEYEES